MVLVGPLWIIALVVSAAGAWKVAQPLPAATALRSIGLRTSGSRAAVLVRVAGAGEFLLGLAAIVWGGRLLCLALAGAYGGFAAVVLRLRAKPGGPPCGCFGASSTPAGPLHLAVNVVSAVVALAAAAADVPGLGAAWPDLPAGGVAHGLTVAVGALGVIALLTTLPDTRALAAEVTGRNSGNNENHGNGNNSGGNRRLVLFGPTIPRKEDVVRV